MRLFLIVLIVLLASWTWLAPACAEEEQGAGKAQGAAIAVIDFDYIDTSGEERDQRGEHQARLDSFMRSLRRDLTERGSFHLVAPICAPDPCVPADLTASNLVAAAREAGASILLVGGVHKVSTLVQWAKIEAIDAGTGRVMFDRLFTFRGDTDEAWRRAEAFIVEEIIAMSGQPSSR
jgi:uncharacterized protein DUF2380